MRWPRDLPAQAAPFIPRLSPPSAGGEDDLAGLGVDPGATCSWASSSAARALRPSHGRTTGCRRARSGTAASRRALRGGAASSRRGRGRSPLAGIVRRGSSPGGAAGENRPDTLPSKPLVSGAPPVGPRPTVLSRRSGSLNDGGPDSYNATRPRRCPRGPMRVDDSGRERGPMTTDWITDSTRRRPDLQRPDGASPRSSRRSNDQVRRRRPRGALARARPGRAA